MSEEELRKHRCCFTGHRPDKLKIPERQLAVLLEREIREAVDRQFTTFITGMAKGTDLIAAEIVLRLREHDSRLKLIAALPYPDFGLHWGGGWTESESPGARQSSTSLPMRYFPAGSSP